MWRTIQFGVKAFGVFGLYFLSIVVGDIARYRLASLLGRLTFGNRLMFVKVLFGHNGQPESSCAKKLEQWKCRPDGKRGKHTTVFPLFPQPLEIAKNAITTFGSWTVLVLLLSGQINFAATEVVNSCRQLEMSGSKDGLDHVVN